MSQQISSPTTGGLLALNSTVPAQGTASFGSGEGALFSGFGTMLTQQSSGSTEGNSLHDGVFLPQTGIKLPPSAAEPPPEEVTMQQQMLHIAQLLEQQVGGDISSEVSAELAKALKQYADQKPVIPVEPVHQNVDDLRDAEITLIADAAIEGMGAVTESSTTPVTEVVMAPESSSKEVGLAGRSSSEADLLAAGRKAEASTQVQQSSGSERSDKENAGQLASALDSAVELQTRADHSARVGVQNGLSENADLAKANAAPQVEREVMVKTAAVQNQIDVAAASSEVKAKEMSASTIAPAASFVAGKSGAEKVQRDAVNSESSNEAAAIVRKDPLLDTAGDKKDRFAASERSLVQEGVVAKLNTADKPMLEMSAPQKFESALELSQQFLQKVTAGDKVVDTGFNQRMESLSAVASQTQSLSVPTQVQKTVSDAQNFMMPQHAKFNTPAWSNALGERAIMISAQNARVAEIRLDPPELGSLKVRVNINQDQVSLNFTSPHAHVRDAVEQSMPRLREMFAEQGLALQDSSVSDQSSDQQKREAFAEQSADGDTQYGGRAGADDGQVDDVQNGKPVSLVDYYA
jgi:flagellar hook-length control protein FliK